MNATPQAATPADHLFAPPPPRSVLFVTGKLAEPALRRELERLAPRVGFDYSVAVLPITVAALATTPWIARHLSIPPDVDRVLLPGLCRGDLEILRRMTTAEVERGPTDLHDLPEFFHTEKQPPAEYGGHDIAILAEINHAPQLAREELLSQARSLRDDGADVIDLGCDPGSTWSGVGEAVRALRGEGMRVSIDSFDPAEVQAAVRAGAELILSVNGSNVEAARDWGCEVVVLPDDPASLGGLDRTVQKLDAWGVPFRIDPILEPIGLGFAGSLGRYLEARRRYPEAEMLMGVGNVTELTDGDSAGINTVLLGFCQELGIRSVLTTQVINWCRTCVRELALARALVYHACTRRVVPKRLEPRLVLLRDPKLRPRGREDLEELAGRITDPNFRLFAEGGEIHALSANLYLRGTDPFALFREIQRQRPVDPGHAFYLGYEMAKAVTALTLGKQYTQDQALRWGFLTATEREAWRVERGA